MKILSYLFLFLCCLFLFTRSLGVHGIEYRDDEIFYFQSTQEMMQSGDVLSPTYFGHDRFQKPILFYWFVLLSYKFFGINWFGARFVAAVFASLSVCVTFALARRFFNQRVAYLSAIILMTIPLFFRHAKNVVPDMALNFFIVLAIYFAVKYKHDKELSKNNFPKFHGTLDGERQNKQVNYSCLIPRSVSSNNSSGMWRDLFFVACGLGFMIKGFAAFIVPFGTLIFYGWFIKKEPKWSVMHIARGVLILAVIIVPWFVYMIKVHGSSYFQYMVMNETKDRLLGQGGTSGNFLLQRLEIVGGQTMFYIKNIFSYFAPWSLFAFVAIPWELARQFFMKNEEERYGVQLCLIWFFVVFGFFVNMSFAINHYMLVLTTPFAILVAHFFLQDMNKKFFIGKVVMFLRKYILIMIFVLGCFAFSFLAVFLAGVYQGWLIVISTITFYVIRKMHQSPKAMTAPLILGLFIVFVFSQSSLMNKAGVTSHASLQKFARTIHKIEDKEFSIGVGSHDIHEKEFQVYFKRRVEKVATSDERETAAKIAQFFASPNLVYCLLTQRDYDLHVKGMYPVIQKEYTFRRRIYVDKDFFMALLKLDQETVYHYLMEPVVLVKKEKDV